MAVRSNDCRTHFVGDDCPGGHAPSQVVGESRIREVHAMCAGCGRRPVELPGERCAECAPEVAG